MTRCWASGPSLIGEDGPLVFRSKRRSAGRLFLPAVVFGFAEVFAPPARVVVRGILGQVAGVLAGGIAVARRRCRSHSEPPKGIDGTDQAGERRRKDAWRSRPAEVRKLPAATAFELSSPAIRRLPERTSADWTGYGIRRRGCHSVHGSPPPANTIERPAFGPLSRFAHP